MGKMVDAELKFETLAGERAWRHHDAGIVDKHVDRRVFREQPCRESLHIIEIGEVEEAQVKAGIGDSRLDARTAARPLASFRAVMMT